MSEEDIVYQRLVTGTYIIPYEGYWTINNVTTYYKQFDHVNLREGEGMLYVKAETIEEKNPTLFEKLKRWMRWK